jgi:uncharacterized protein YodC (DUF2158 family)
MGFAIGDTVRLKSGGAIMTVEKIDGLNVHCVWQREGETKREPFAAAILEKYVQPGPTIMRRR